MTNITEHERDFVPRILQELDAMGVTELTVKVHRKKKCFVVIGRTPGKGFIESECKIECQNVQDGLKALLESIKQFRKEMKIE